MHEVMIRNWNSVVSASDLVYHLGDFAFCYNKSMIKALRDKLNGRIILIAGNHDRAKSLDIGLEFIPMIKRNGMKIYPVCRISCGEQQIVLSHYAMRVWDKSHWGVWHLYGHSHGNLPDDPNSLSMDVGVDCNDFTPLSFDQVKEKMGSKKFRPVDHHQRKEDR